ncbi:hypothetical protein [Methylovulum miyakonense]|uniref:hypothetical protein n=1 Tax=Methylovulum miyakonense TaxID=645578 RepID=UPI000363FCCE|nr:hypothetical protein [Methylovulum miyakonense]
MQDIHLTLHDPQLEQALLRLAKQQQQNLPEFVLSILSRYVNETEQPETLSIQKLDPFQHSQAPSEKFQSPENNADLVFADIDDSLNFAKQLRQQAWQRHD